MAIKDGGPAFPVAPASASAVYGMTLRDYFAGQCLAGMTNGVEAPNGSYIAEHCYAMADAMLKAREGK